MDRYLSVLFEIVTRGLNTNSYKFALWRALANLAPQTDAASPKISKRDLSLPFLQYYWPLETKFRIRQSTDPDRDPVVMKLIRQRLLAGRITQGESLNAFQRRSPQEHQVLLDQIAQRAFDDVIPRFHIVHGKPITPAIYYFTGRPGRAGGTIELTPGVRQFLIEHKNFIDYVAVSGWVRFTEQFTSAPRLHDKIDGAKSIRSAVGRWRNALAEIQNGKCFYDDTHEMKSPEVDHVVPWSFVLEDKTWNLVLACRKCNNEKRGRLTDIVSLQRLCARNAGITSGQISADLRFCRDFNEWHSRDLAGHIKSLYDQAASDGFPGWIENRW